MGFNSAFKGLIYIETFWNFMSILILMLGAAGNIITSSHET